MVQLPGSVRAHLCLTARDMRKSFDVRALVREHLELDAFTGHLFAFTSRWRVRVKFCFGTVTDSQCGASDWRRARTWCRSSRGPRSRREITVQELGALLSGIDLN
jgi:hypothetical protein